MKTNIDKKKMVLGAMAMAVAVPVVMVPVGTSANGIPPDYVAADAGKNDLKYSENMRYKVNPDGKTVTITWYSSNDSQNAREVVIPDTIDGKTVTDIGDYAFLRKGAWDYTIKSVVLPSTIKTIGDFAFDDNAFESLVLPEGLTHIGKYAFRQPSVNLQSGGITNIVLPSTIETIGDYAFYNHRTYKMNIPGNLKHLGKFVFGSGKKRLGSMNVVFEEGVEIIDDNAFGTVNVHKLKLPSTLKHIGANALGPMPELGDMVLPDGIEFIGDKAFGDLSYYAVKSINLPVSLKHVGADVFSSRVVTGDLPDGLEFIGDRAFASSTMDSGGGKITIPPSVKSIGNNAFESSKHTGVIYNEGLERIGDSVFANNPISQDDVYLPSTLKHIGANSFTQFTMKDLTLPVSLESIGESAFEGLPLEGKIKFNEGLLSIGNKAFKNVGITDLVLPKSILSIGEESFMDNNIERLVIPDGTTTLGAGAFKDNNITEIQIPKSATSIADSVLDNNQFVASFLSVYGKAGSRAHAVAMEKGYTFNDEKMPNPPTNEVTPPEVEEPVEPVEPVDPVDPVDPVEPVDPVDPVEPVEPVDPPLVGGGVELWEPEKGGEFVTTMVPEITVVGGNTVKGITLRNFDFGKVETVSTELGDVTFTPDGKGNTVVSAVNGIGTNTTSQKLDVKYKGTHILTLNVKAKPVLNFKVNLK